MIKVTYEQILSFRRNQEQYVRMHPGQFGIFLYALNKVNKKLQTHIDDFNEKQQGLNLQFCAKDKDGYALMEKSMVERRGEKHEEEKYKFTTEKQKELQKANRALLNEEVEVQEFISTDIPEDLDFSWWGVFSPFILKDLDSLEGSDEGKAILEKLYARTAEKTKPKMVAS